MYAVAVAQSNSFWSLRRDGSQRSPTHEIEGTAGWCLNRRAATEAQGGGVVAAIRMTVVREGMRTSSTAAKPLSHWVRLR